MLFWEEWWGSERGNGEVQERCWRGAGEVLERCWTGAGEMWESRWGCVEDVLGRRSRGAGEEMCYSFLPSYGPCSRGDCINGGKEFSNVVLGGVVG